MKKNGIIDIANRRIENADAMIGASCSIDLTIGSDDLQNCIPNSIPRPARIPARMYPSSAAIGMGFPILPWDKRAISSSIIVLYFSTDA
ncbi:MAG: hypothetical protein QXF17_05630 [Ignisphaera sp.]